PKNQRQHKRKARTVKQFAAPDRYRIEASWNDRPDKPAATTTSDRKKARALARKWADSGAYVIVQENTGWHVWRTVDEVDGPALLAERHAADETAAAGYPPDPPGYRPDAADRNRTWLDDMHQRAAAATEQPAAEDAERQRRRRPAAEASRAPRRRRDRRRRIPARPARIPTRRRRPQPDVARRHAPARRRRRGAAGRRGRRAAAPPPPRRRSHPHRPHPHEPAGHRPARTPA